MKKAAREVFVDLTGETQIEEFRGISRRSLITGTATAVVGITAAGLLGCSPSTNINASGVNESTAVEPTASASGSLDALYALDPVGEPSETIQADVVIIGGGGSGLIAAIQASQLGLESVVLEKEGSVGGSYLCTEGIYVMDNKYQNEIGISYDIGEFIPQQMDYHHWLTSPTLIRAYFDQINENVDWAESIGIQFGPLVDIGGHPKMVLTWKHDPNSNLPGKLMVDSLAAAADDAGIEVMLQTPAKKILVEGGKIAGVLAEKGDGSIVKIEAPAVVIATGGFGKNNDMLAELGGFVAPPLDVGMPGRDGDGLKMGLDIGARRWDFPGTTTVSGPVVLGASWATLPVLLCLSPLLWLNQDAQRFIREDLTNINFTYSGNACKMQKRLLVVFAQKDLDHYENVGPYSPIFSLITPDVPMTGIGDALTRIGDEYGTVYTGKTLDELAQAANLDVAELKESVERYNGFCSAGEDKDFGKQAQYLNPLETGPYYALECGDVLYGTAGSLYVSADCECVDSELAPIPGLFAAGIDAGGLYADAYDANMAPCSLAGWVLNSGRSAAKGVARYLGR